MLEFTTMSVWAVIKTGGKQYKVTQGQSLAVEKLEGKDGKVTFDKVLALGGEKTQIGTPLIQKAKVTAKVLQQFRDKKIRVVKFKSKSRYTRTSGHRQNLTRVLIEKISV